MLFPKRWWGMLFHSLMILMKKEYLKAFTFADFMRIHAYDWLRFSLSTLL